MKKLGLGLLVLLLLIGGGAYYLYSNFGSLVKAAVEKYGSAATQASVKLDGVKVDVVKGSGALSGLTVGNPAGFATPRALSLDDIEMSLDTASISGAGPIVIREIVIQQPIVTYERIGSAGNLEALQKNTNAYAKSMKGKSAEGQAEGNDKAARKLVIKDLYVRNGKIAITHSALKGQVLTTNLPEIHLTNIGEGRGGATPAEIVQEVLGAILKSAANVGSKELVSQLGTAALGSVGGGAVDTSGAGKALKGLFDQ